MMIVLVPCTAKDCVCIEVRTAKQAMLMNLRESLKDKGMFTEKEARNLAMTRDQLAKGEDIFAEAKMAPSKRESIPMPKREPDMALQEKRWKEGREGKADGKGIRTFRGNHILKELGYEDLAQPIKAEVKKFCEDYYTSDVHIVDSCKACQAMKSGRVLQAEITCSFCGNSTSHVTATRGITDMEIIRDEVVISRDPIVTDEKVRVRTTKVIACPACAHKIKPLTHIECQTCGMSQRKCKCLRFIPKETIKVMNCNTYSEG